MMRSLIVYVAVTSALMGMSSATFCQVHKGDAIPGVGLDQRMNAQVPMDDLFTDADGSRVTLGQVVAGKPTLLNIIFYRCPGVCSLELDGLATVLQQMRLRVGEDFNVVTISINPAESQQLAAAKKAAYLAEITNQPGVAKGWHFLVGSNANIHRLTDAIGFRYNFNPTSPTVAGMFQHPAGLLVLTPKGRVSRYFFTAKYYQRDTTLALVEASNNRIGSAVDRFVLLTCLYHYDPFTNRYGVSVRRLLVLSGCLTVVLLGTFMTVMFVRDKRNSTSASARGPAEALKPNV